jgi:hypothetical protein
MSQLVIGVVQKPYFDWGGRKYIEVLLPDGRLFRIKIPFRYGRVMAKVHGLRPIQDIKSGETVNVFVERKYWDDSIHWVLVSLAVVDSLETQKDHKHSQDPDP